MINRSWVPQVNEMSYSFWFISTEEQEKSIPQRRQQQFYVV